MIPEEGEQRAKSKRSDAAFQTYANRHNSMCDTLKLIDSSPLISLGFEFVCDCECERSK